MGKQSKKKIDSKINSSALKKADRAEKKRVKKEGHKKRDYSSSGAFPFATNVF
jgi:hypothetical protein